MNIVDIVLHANAQHGDHIAIKDEHGALSYSEFAGEVKKLSKVLISKGLKEGMGVGIMDRNSRYFIISVFAVLHCKAVAMPVSNQLKTQELDTILNNAGLNWLLDAGNGPMSSAHEISTYEIQNSKWTIRAYRGFTGERFASHVADPAIVRYTSGTTGLAKGVIIGHNSINERIDGANKALQLGRKDTVVWVLPMSYHFVVSIILYLKYGATIALAKDFLAESIHSCIRATNGTFLYASPMHIKLLSKYVNDKEIPSLKTVISTSTAISREQCELFYERYKIPVSQAYGIIEIGLPIINFDKAAEHPDAVGHVLDGYDVGILSETNELLGEGEIGHLGIKGPGMFDAYLSPAKMRNEVLNKGYFMTGDLASKDASGLVRVEGRKKSMINVSGNKVFPVEVEQVLCSHPDILLARVSGYKHRFMGEIVSAELVLREATEKDAEAIISYCRERLTTYKIPQKIKFVDSLEMTDSGKLKR